MIKFALQCDKEHAFESWFSSNASYDQQAKRGLVSCPLCGSIKIEKALMEPHVSAATRQKGSRDVAVRSSGQQSLQPQSRGNAEPVAMPEITHAAGVALPAELVGLMRKIREEVRKSAEYVGPRFAEEARKIHYEEAPERGIYGEATPQEVKLLHEEGIDFVPLPQLPDDHN